MRYDLSNQCNLWFLNHIGCEITFGNHWNQKSSVAIEFITFNIHPCITYVLTKGTSYLTVKIDECFPKPKCFFCTHPLVTWSISRPKCLFAFIHWSLGKFPDPSACLHSSIGHLVNFPTRVPFCIHPLVTFTAMTLHLYCASDFELAEVM
jgi:hypothetical protein